MRVFTWIFIIATVVFIVCILFVFFQYINFYFVPNVDLVSLKSFLITSVLQIVFNISNITIEICYISTIRGTYSLNAADVPLNNKQTKPVKLVLYIALQIWASYYMLIFEI